MASRTKQKEEARARRMAEEQARAERDRRQRRVRMLTGVIVAAVAVVAVLIAISVSNSGKKGGLVKSGAKQTQLVTQVSSLIGSIPESGNSLGSPAAKVTVTEYGDLECPICRDFALGAQNQLIANEVRAGKVKMVYRSLDTATGNGSTPNMFGAQQAAALAAGLQGKEWYYVELFYHQQGQEGTPYVNQSFLDTIARQIPGLNYSKWQSDSQSASLLAQVNSDQQQAASKGFNSTPTIVVQGPKGSAQPIVGSTDYGTLQTAIKSVQ